MPASNYDPVGNALTNSFNKGGGGSKRSVDETMESNLRKSLLVPVQFDDPIRHTPSAMKSSYITLNTARQQQENIAPSSGSSGSPQQASKKSTVDQHRLDQVPLPKITLYRRDQIQLGHQHKLPGGGGGPSGPGAGMWNMGNTCYLNSTLQALFHIPAFTNYLRAGGHDTECNLSGFSSCCTICILASTLRQSQQPSVGVIKPAKLYEKLKFICKHLMHGRQEDAHEFLRYLIESLQRCYLLSRKVPKNLDNYSKETTPFNQIFGGYMRQELHCLKCKHVSITFQHFMDLLLDIRNADNIDSALSGYFKKEMLSQEDAYKCEKCQQKVPAYKIYKLERPPLVLCIQLKRFNMMGGKNGRPVTLAKNLDLSRFVRFASAHNLTFRYRLVSLITHVGPSPNCGHYTAIGEAPNGTYYRFDDSSVNTTSVQNVLNTSAYVIFYEMSKASRDLYLDSHRKPDVVIGPQQPNKSSQGTPEYVKTPLFANHIRPNNQAPQSASKQTQQIADASSPPVATVRPQIRPKLISESSKSSLTQQTSSNNKQLLPTTPPSFSKTSQSTPTGKGGLVPYGGADDSSSDDDDDPLLAKTTPSNTTKSTKSTTGDKPPKQILAAATVAAATAAVAVLPPATAAASSDCSNGGQKVVRPLLASKSTAFLPRAVAAQIKKTNKESVSDEKQEAAVKDLNIYEEKDLMQTSNTTSSQSSSASVECGQSAANWQGISGTSNNQKGSGLFTVHDKETHDPSINSDNSTGSTHSFTVTDISLSAASCSSRPLCTTTASATATVAAAAALAPTTPAGWNVTSAYSNGKCSTGNDTSSSSSQGGGVKSSSSSKRDRHNSAADDATGLTGDAGHSTRQNGGAVSESEALSSPQKRAKVLQSHTEKAKKSMLDEVKSKTTETLREFGKDVFSAGVKFKQQFGIRSNKVTDKVSDKLFKMGKNLEDALPRGAEESSSSTSCPPSTSQGSSKALDSDWSAGSDSAATGVGNSSLEKRKKAKKKKKKKKKMRSRHNSESDAEWEERRPVDDENADEAQTESLCASTTTASGSSSSVSRPLQQRASSPQSTTAPAQRTSSWNMDAPVKRWDSKPDIKQIGRSVTWDGSKGSNFVDELKKASAIRSWSGERSAFDKSQEPRKRSADSDEELDRGRLKKVKKRKEERSLDYNPFQVAQNIKDRGGPSWTRNNYDREKHSSSSAGGRGDEDRFGHHRDHHRDKQQQSQQRDYNSFGSRGGGGGDYSSRDRDHRDHHRDYRNHHTGGGRHSGSSGQGFKHDRRSWDHNYHRQRGHSVGDRNGGGSGRSSTGSSRWHSSKANYLSP